MAQVAMVEKSDMPIGTADFALLLHSPKCALLVEDNVVIALDTSDILQEAGVAEVRVASTAEQGMAMLAQGDIDFALLDVSLGSTTSLEVALALAARHIPFVVTTGCDNASGTLSAFPPAPILQKPYSSTEILGAVASLFDR